MGRASDNNIELQSHAKHDHQTGNLSMTELLEIHTHMQKKKKKKIN